MFIATLIRACHETLNSCTVTAIQRREQLTVRFSVTFVGKAITRLSNADSIVLRKVTSNIRNAENLILLFSERKIRR